ncbi:MAG TPA: vWA domain-containing protein [Candidatus Paceibacterota bacterium]|nr:vWA domain-containing protein [Candidatus Paceibacterota bacterium]
METYIKPKTGRNTKAGDRYFVLQKTIEPVFRELLKKDLDEWQPEWKKPEPPQENQNSEKQQKKEETEGEENRPSQDQPAENKPEPTPFEKEIHEWDENNMDQLPPEAPDEVAKKINEAATERKKEEEIRKEAEERRRKEGQKSAEEKAQETARKQDEQWAEKNETRGRSKQELLHELERFRAIEKDIAPYLGELSQLWRKIVFGKSRQSVSRVVGHFKTGEELDVEQVVSEWPNIVQGKHDMVRPFKRKETAEIVTNTPELIRVRLLADMSFSMKEMDKLITLQRTIALLLSSIEEFNTYLNATRSETKTKLRAETEVIRFSSSAQKIKSFNDRNGAEAVTVFSRLGVPDGLTFDSGALQHVLESISPEDEELMRQGKILDILIEVTDGGSTDKESARLATEDLLKKRVVVRAFQIGKTSPAEKDAFNYVWNKDMSRPHGEIVGSNIAALVPAVTKALKEYLGNVQI